ncbi:hypothetical protein EXN66_Car004994 [Channa argus]|uniref:Uncharacterized protein n=1 Tax=Channa argus TaxID=215402 RepID=A0A6G1PGG1_CHAAH|nr:hypothetical protein EXN66_Car004994 [Channa argus]
MTEEYVLRCVLMLCCVLLSANASNWLTYILLLVKRKNDYDQFNIRRLLDSSSAFEQPCKIKSNDSIRYVYPVTMLYLKHIIQ